jgi:hypothetical protein
MKEFLDRYRLKKGWPATMPEDTVAALWFEEVRHKGPSDYDKILEKLKEEEYPCG